MKFNFRFESVLKHRKVLEDLAQREFQEVNSRLQNEIQKLHEMHEASSKAQSVAFQRQSAGGQAGPALSQVNEFLKGQDIRIERQRLKVQEIEKQVEEMREILRQKAIDYKIIESLKEKKKEDFKKEAAKKEQKVTDDIASMRTRTKK